MKYTKPPLTFDQQADLLIRRGLVVSDRKTLLVHLSNVSYCRLSAYWYPFRQQDDTLKPATAFEMIWRRARWFSATAPLPTTWLRPISPPFSSSTVWKT